MIFIFVKCVFPHNIKIFNIISIIAEESLA